jgi:diguanylate cyclase (GGDEF)-like protein
VTPLSSWTIERTVRSSIILIASMAVLLMAALSWKLTRDAGEDALRELTEISVAAAQARLGDSVQKQVREFEQIAASPVISAALMDSSGGREASLAPLLEQRTLSTGIIFAIYDDRGRLLTHTAGRDDAIGASAMAGEPPGARLRDIDFRVSKEWIELEAPIRFFAENKPLGFLVGSIRPAHFAADTSVAASKFYSASVQFYVTPAFIEQPMHLKIIETPRSTLAARMELAVQASWIDDTHDKQMVMGLLATFVMLVASVIGARFTARIVSAPIAELTEAVKKLRNGEKAVEPSGRMPAEIRNLASALFLAFDERSAALHKVQSLAHYDGVTGALSRAYFDHRARNLLQIATRTHEPATLLYIDLDRFKDINDAYGHDAGDLLLQAVVTRARKRLRSVDLIGRRGGDEFVVFLPNTMRPEAVADLASELARLITEPVEIDGETRVEVGVSMGAAVFPDDAEQYDALVTCADKAMYEAKKAGRGRLSFTSGVIIELTTAARCETSGAA